MYTITVCKWPLSPLLTFRDIISNFVWKFKNYYKLKILETHKLNIKHYKLKIFVKITISQNYLYQKIINKAMKRDKNYNKCSWDV